MPVSDNSDSIKRELRTLLLDPSLSKARNQYISTVVGVIDSVDGWLAIDSMFGGGRVSDTREPGEVEAFREFRAVSMMVSITCELAVAARVMMERRRYYSVAALVRQLLECEYHLALFAQDLNQAKVWHESSPDEIRNSFRPAQMRTVGGFSNDEYRVHCARGGHPAPTGAPLLERHRPERKAWHEMGALMTVDLGLHLSRIWSAIDHLLVKNHARYEYVRADKRRQAEGAWMTWWDCDPVARLNIEDLAPYLEH